MLGQNALKGAVDKAVSGEALRRVSLSKGAGIGPGEDDAGEEHLSKDERGCFFLQPIWGSGVKRRDGGLGRVVLWKVKLRMILDIQALLNYEVEGLATVLLQIEAAALPDQRILEARTEVREMESLTRVPAEDGVGERSWIRVSDAFVCEYRARVEVDRPAVEWGALRQVPMHELPGEVVKYTLGSRFILPETLAPFVEAEFGALEGGARVAAMRDWIEQNVDYVRGSSDETTTAVDTFLGRQGICRDYAHLIIAFARASQIPARMVSVYAPSVQPPDFHAVAEVYLSGGWHLVDATGMATADMMVKMGVGRDAADIAFMTVMSPSTLVEQSVSVQEA